MGGRVGRPSGRFCLSARYGRGAGVVECHRWCSGLALKTRRALVVRNPSLPAASEQGGICRDKLLTAWNAGSHRWRAAA